MREFTPLWRDDGFSLAEIIIFSGVTVTLGLWGFQQIRTAHLLQKRVFDATLQKQAFEAVDLMLTDIKEAYPNSIGWTTILPAAGGPIDRFSFSKAVFDPGAVSYSRLIPYELRYDAATRAIRLSIDGVWQANDAVRSVDPPTAADPLVQLDTTPDSFHVLIVTVMFRPEGGDPLKIVRHVATKG